MPWSPSIMEWDTLTERLKEGALPTAAGSRGRGALSAFAVHQ